MASFTLCGRVGVVTGAGSDIGKAMAQSLAAEDVVLYLMGRNQGALEATARSIEERNSKAFLLRTDFEKEGDVRRAVERLKEQTGVLISSFTAPLSIHSAAWKAHRQNNSTNCS